jgi:hypothetical protein
MNAEESLMKTAHESKSVQGAELRTDGPSTATRRGGRLAGWLAAAMLLGSAACSLPEAKPDLTRYYVLTPVAAKVDSPAAERPAVLVRSVAVPEFLRGRIMQVRVSENELRFIDEARWAEPLEAGVLRVLRENLERAGSVRVVDRGSERHDYEVVVRLRRCEGALPGGAARITARIELFSTEIDPKLVAQDEFTSEVPGWDGSDHADLAKKLSQAAAALSERIATLVPAKS